MNDHWSAEIWRLVKWLAAGLALGLLFDRVALFLLLGLAIYAGFTLLSLYRLDEWVGRGVKGAAPPARGVWGEIGYQLEGLQQRNRRTKRRLASYLARFRELYAALPDAVVVLEPNGRIEWFNDAASRLLGLRSAQDRGQRILNLVRNPLFVDYMQRGDFGEAVEFPAPGDEHVRLSARVITYGGDQRLLVARDVTRLHQLEQVRRDFIANVSHELRTPLTVLNGFIETLRDEVPPQSETWTRSLDLMREQGARMQQIVEDLLLLSRLESEREALRGEVDVPALAAMLVEEARALSGDRQHDIQLHAEPGLWLLGAEKELRSAFSNVISNAVRYTAEQGRIDIRWYADEAGAHFEVQDTGEGIAAYHIPRLTERFYRVDAGRSRAAGGTGLGLAIVKHVLQRHEAELRIESELGKGSLFRCDFPPERVVRR